MSQKLAAYDAAGNITTYYDDVLSPPPDGVPTIEITPAQWQACLRLRGWKVENGELVAPTAPTAAQIHDELVAEALDDTRIQRQPIISILDGLQSSALAKGDAATATEIETAKQSLRDITKVDLSGCTTYDDMKAAMLTAYRAIAAAAPASVQLAFTGALQ